MAFIWDTEMLQSLKIKWMAVDLVGYTDNAIFPRILPNEGETTGNNVPVRVQRR